MNTLPLSKAKFDPALERVMGVRQVRPPKPKPPKEEKK